MKTAVEKVIQRIWTDIRNNKWAIMIVIAYFVIMSTVFHQGCPQVLLTGYPCAACGLTRAGTALLKLDFRRALEMNLFIYPIAAMILVYVFNRYIRGKAKQKWLVYGIILLFILMTGYYFYRMYRYFPNQSPMTFYEDNILHFKLFYARLK
ncbi:hypothetical protein M2454_000494 [Aequitasia blattaphilus]|uniref:DUF2752 domain-containing protein n=1 Tax=Aequitasia blattaphilus TaxID=2949332 RepID=A0ABT1E806_9FIRM|nr:DUF2752 domain-containing protein [Aequitasia blattaphilus]MCP1101117.1 DUF2752 domain-containing protein [Aequitasia blattaphilus]MCR8613757.1 DUF2752 domain-containing protein [Aequitasia blattaphilus]